MSKIYRDPINGNKIKVRSICYPTKTLYNGKVYSRNPQILTRKPQLGDKNGK